MPSTTERHVIAAQRSQPLATDMRLVRNTGWVVALALSSLVSVASAQAVLRGQSASGNASFSDQASPSNNQNQPSATAPRLPAPLQQSVARYPVKMYASPDCNGCKLGRELLQRRGIPFQEYRIASPAAQRAASNLGISTLPHLMIGTQALKGYDSQDWANYLTAAGYPESSVLPANYQAPAVQNMLPDAPATPPDISTPSGSGQAEPSNQSPAPSEGFRF